MQLRLLRLLWLVSVRVCVDLIVLMWVRIVYLFWLVLWELVPVGVPSWRNRTSSVAVDVMMTGMVVVVMTGMVVVVWIPKLLCSPLRHLHRMLGMLRVVRVWMRVASIRIDTSLYAVHHPTWLPVRSRGRMKIHLCVLPALRFDLFFTLATAVVKM